MRVTGQFNGQPLNILVDTGSTHNFLDTNTAKQMGCQLKQTYPLQVSIPGSNNLISRQECKGFVWQMQGEMFQTDVMLLPLGGCEMVLGMQWLSTLGDVLCNFLKLRMHFVHKGKKVVITGTSQPMIKWMDGKKLSKEVNVGHAGLYSMAVCVYPTSGLQAECKSTNVENVETKVKLLLEKYENVFAVPKGLPPNRTLDHRIPLKDNTSPTNIRPYRHPPTQKDAIEEMVKELLDSGVISSSHSPFSSPIVMVKKKMDHGECVWITEN